MTPTSALRSVAPGTSAPARSAAVVVVEQLVADAGSVLRARAGLLSLGIGLAFIALTTAGAVVSAEAGTGPLAGLPADVAAHQLVGGGFLAGLFAAAACATAVVRDINSGLYGAAVLRHPRWFPVVLAKAATAALVGLVFALAGTATAATAGAVAQRLVGLQLPIAAEITGALGGVTLAVVAQAVLGALVGWLVQRSGPSVMVLIAWIVIAEPAVMAAWPDTARWLLSGGAAGVMDDVSIPGRPDFALGIAVQVAWLVAAATLALLLVARRDVASNTLQDRS